MEGSPDVTLPMDAVGANVCEEQNENNALATENDPDQEKQQVKTNNTKEEETVKEEQESETSKKKQEPLPFSSVAASNDKTRTSTLDEIDLTADTDTETKQAVTKANDKQQEQLQQPKPTQSVVPKRTQPFVPLAPKGWRARAMRSSNGKLYRLIQAALLKTVLHAIRCGSVEGVKVAIERGVNVHYIDSRQRNLIMHAMKCDTDARLEIVIILSDAGCDINHSDQLGWSCLHYACASGALDAATELIRRGARVEFNPYGYGPEDFIIPKVIRAKSLLQHTEQLHHEQAVKQCWDFFRRNAEKTGYGVKCKSRCDLGKPLKITFHALAGHSTLDRIRVVDMNSDVPLWLQVSKNFTIPPGNIGTITLDSETLDRPSLYRIFYEKYEPTPIQLPQDVTEHNLCVRNLDTGTTVSMGSVNELVMKHLNSTRSTRNAKHLSNSARPAPESAKVNTAGRRLSTTTATKKRDDTEFEEEIEFSTEETITSTEISEHPAVTSITGVYKIVAMGIVSVSTLKTAKANEYEIVIKHDGPLGLHMESRREKSKRSTQLIVRRSSGQSAAVSPGDCLVAIGNANIEHAGLKHTLWELNEAKRPLVLRFRRGNATEKKSLFALCKPSNGRRLASIAV